MKKIQIMMALLLAIFMVSTSFAKEEENVDANGKPTGHLYVTCTDKATKEVVYRYDLKAKSTYWYIDMKQKPEKVVSAKNLVDGKPFELSASQELQYNCRRSRT